MSTSQVPPLGFQIPTNDMEPEAATDIKANLLVQLDELETLQSMFCNPGELRMEDPLIVPDILAYTSNFTNQIPRFLDLTINLTVETSKFEVCVTLPNEYPHVEPDIFVRNHKLDKKRHANLNRDLLDYVKDLPRGDPCVFSAISWLQDNALNYVVAEEIEEIKEEEDGSMVRYWIYSHHIYSKTKRREIGDLAKSLNITGFCMPGKPGVVCVEGRVRDCDEWWQTIKSMNWKRIFCKISEECTESPENFRKFQSFDEMVFQTSSIKCNHMDMGELFKFLEDHQCGYIFKEIFGVESKTSA